MASYVNSENAGFRSSRIWDFGWSLFRRKVGFKPVVWMVLLFLALGAVASGLEGVVRGLGAIENALLNVILAGLGLGWWTATRRRNFLVPTLGYVIGNVFIFFWFGSLLLDLWFLGRALWVWLLEWVVSQWPAPTAIASTSLEAINLAWLELARKTAVYVTEIRVWISGWVSADPEFNPRALEFFWGTLFWTLAFLTGHITRKNGRFEMPMFAAGGILLFALSFARHDSHYYLLVFSVPVLLLFAFRTLQANEDRWRRTFLDYAEYLRFDFIVAVSVWVLLLAAAAYLVPAARDWVRINAWTRRDPPTASSGEDSGRSVPIGDLLGISSPTPTQAYLATYQNPGLPRSHLLGSGPELGQQVVMMVHVENQGDPETADFKWRGLVYDRYIGNGWTVGPQQQESYPGGAVLRLAQNEPGRVLRQIVQETSSIGQLAYAAGDIISMDQPFEVSWIEGTGEHREIFGVRQQADQYRVDSVVPAYTIDQLRNSPSGYPAWIRDRYLSLPETLPARVTELALEITREETNPFDRARALEQYLRGFRYTLDLPAPPADRDVVDYFLFDLQQGYCDYYATAMVVMARANGLPARLAVGYNAGVYDPANQRYIVTAQQAHSWPEIYFPGAGWIAFEPTAGVEPILWEQISTDFIPGDFPLEGMPESGYLTWSPGNTWMWMAAGFFGLIGAVFLIDFIWLKSRSPKRFFAMVMQRLYRFQRRRGGPGVSQPTPYELAKILQQALSKGNQNQFRLPAWLDCRFEIGRLAEYHVLSSYSAMGVGKNEQQVGQKLWMKLRYKLLFVRLWLIFQWKTPRRTP